jgi:hypothetical protein
MFLKKPKQNEIKIICRKYPSSWNMWMPWASPRRNWNERRKLKTSKTNIWTCKKYVLYVESTELARHTEKTTMKCISTETRKRTADGETLKLARVPKSLTSSRGYDECKHSSYKNIQNYNFSCCLENR